MDDKLADFIECIINEKHYLKMWHMNYSGELELVILYYKDGAWEYHSDNGLNTTITRLSTSKIRQKLSVMLLDYDIDWEDCKKSNRPILISYRYGEDGKNVLIDMDYSKRLMNREQKTLRKSLSETEQKKLNNEIHLNYLDDVRKHNRVRQDVYNEIKRINPEKAKKIKLNLNDNPEPINYIHCKISSNELAQS